MEQSKRGGARIGAGRKSVGNSKKQTVTLYVEKNKIWLFGNEDKMKQELYGFIEKFKNALEKPIEPIKPVLPIRVAETTFFQKTASKAFKTLEQYKKEKLEIESEEDYQKWLEELNADQNFSQKQKDLIIKYN